jgi:hypothetical protein
MAETTSSSDSRGRKGPPGKQRTTDCTGSPVLHPEQCSALLGSFAADPVTDPSSELLNGMVAAQRGIMMLSHDTERNSVQRPERGRAVGRGPSDSNGMKMGGLTPVDGGDRAHHRAPRGGQKSPPESDSLVFGLVVEARNAWTARDDPSTECPWRRRTAFS